jgi:hypothetical protein
MRRPKGVPCHECTPHRDRRIPVITGDNDLDASILKNPNRDMARRLPLHSAMGAPGYGPLTGYDGYRNYSGDS